MKTVRHSPLDKAQTIIASLVLGCAHTKAINDTLGEEEAAANYLGKERWPDQSQINRYLTRFTTANVDERGAVHEQALRQESRARRTGGLLVVDIDQCGLVANGQTDEFQRKGYFPGKRGDKGYQLSLAYIGAYEEAVALYLDPGNVHCKGRLPDLLRATDRLCGPEETAVELLRRLDAGYDSAANRVTLAGLPGYVLLKGADSALVDRLAQRIPLPHWLPLADDVHGAEVAPDASGLRREDERHSHQRHPGPRSSSATSGAATRLPSIGTTISRSTTSPLEEFRRAALRATRYLWPRSRNPPHSRQISVMHSQRTAS